MVEIDWNKAPEGATHYDCRPFISPAFMRKGFGDKEWEFYGDGKWRDYSGLSDSEAARFIARPQWLGPKDGLPPVGSVCEIKHETLGWTRCEIVAHKHMDCGGKPHAIAWIDGNTLDQSQGIRFRPIRTPEQIEAEVRQKEINAMKDISIRANLKNIDPEAALYDAGYRKFEITDDSDPA